MGVHVLAIYIPKEGHEADLEEEMVNHVPLLRGLGLATETPSTVLRASDGTIAELFEWVDHDAIAVAHGHPQVLEMWARYDACSTYGTLAELPNAQEMFAEFELIGSY